MRSYRTNGTTGDSSAGAEQQHFGYVILGTSGEAVPVQNSSTLVTQFSSPFLVETTLTIGEILLLFCDVAVCVVWTLLLKHSAESRCMYRRLHWSDTIMYKEVCSAVAGKAVVSCVTARNVDSFELCRISD